MDNASWLADRPLVHFAQVKAPAIGRAFIVRSILLTTGLTLGLSILLSQAGAQNPPASRTDQSPVVLVQPSGPGQATPPITITLQDALERARKNDLGFLTAVGDAKSAHEDRLQSRNAMLPSLSESTQFSTHRGME